MFVGGLRGERGTKWTVTQRQFASTSDCRTAVTVHKLIHSILDAQNTFVNKALYRYASLVDMVGIYVLFTGSSSSLELRNTNRIKVNLNKIMSSYYYIDARILD